ncbi:vacuolar protein sorting-associated protein 16 homolog [Tubulanus polymorphus]|uniref:vacuolar protein sorting-associated protein 16 homolog n=1 Tax=Tubulanus polymorphus TaxID=672921 RepID=UPI003DA2FBA1
MASFMMGEDYDSPTADWDPLGNDFYRKFELYNFGTAWTQEVNLDRYKITAANYGGPIAVLRDTARFSTVPSNTKPVILIYTSSGQLIAQKRWTSGTILELGWSTSEELLCCQDNGSVLIHNMYGVYQRTFSMGQEAMDMKVIDCKFFNSYNGTGLAVITANYRIFVVNNIDDPRIRKMADIPGLDRAPSSWTIINHDRQARVLVAKDALLYSLDHGGQHQDLCPHLQNQPNAFVEMATSFNNRFLALYTDTGTLWIGRCDLQTVSCEFDTGRTTKPKQLSWCGGGAVVAVWDDGIMMVVGHKKDKIEYFYEGTIHLVPELDGIRVISNNLHEFIQRVPSASEDVFKIGSMCPGAMLYEASKQFQRKSQHADDYIRMIKDRLDVAVDECIEAGGQEFNTSRQKSLLKAASFGKCFLTDMRPESFVNMCQTLRVLNAIRDYTIGIPLTFNQFQQLTMRVLIDRLIYRRQYYLAIKICQYQKIPEREGASRILAHWACFKVQQTDVPDEQIAQAIANKLGDTPGVSYCEIANKAIDFHRKDLAIRLLDFEPKAAEQVPLLMRLDRYKLAMLKGIESGDSDLVYTVLLHLKDSLPLSEFLMSIRDHPVAYGLYQQYCRQQNPKMLQDLYYQEDNYVEEAACRIIESYSEERLDARISCLNSANESFTKARDDFAAKQTEEQVKLLKYQRRAEEELHRTYLDLSVHDMIGQLFKENNHKLAEQLRKEFKVPDRRFWWLKIMALAEVGDWAELEKFSKSKKSPIGYEPFIEVCMKYDQKREAEKYLQKVVPEKRARCLVKMNDLEAAIDFAFQQKSDEDLQYIFSKCGAQNRPLAEKIQNLRIQLTSKR